jgi:hypothetical protein
MLKERLKTEKMKLCGLYLIDLGKIEMFLIKQFIT